MKLATRPAVSHLLTIEPTQWLLAGVLLAAMLLSGPAMSQEKAVETETSAAAQTSTQAQTDTPTEAPATESLSFQEQIDSWFGTANGYLEPVLFLDMSFGAVEGGIPLIVFFLLLGGIFFTFRFGFINIRLFFHSFQVIRGKYDRKSDHGEITHFQALTSALSATVGLGNIAGVAIAISGGGPGAVFWMWVVAIFGMSSKFASCTLAQVYRRVEKDGSREHVLGGPMLYLSEGMKDMLGKPFGTPFGKVLAISFALFAIGGALGGGNMFQANQTAEIVSFVALDGSKDYAWVIGLIMAALVGLVIVGGIRRIGEVTSKVVPGMCAFYCIVCLVILAANAAQLPGLVGSIFAEAFNFRAAGWGGVIGIMVVGIKRGAFSNEAGLGSAAIAHSAAKTDEPVREGVVAMIGPFIDTIVVCSMTALVILVTKHQISPEVQEKISAITTGSEVQGAALTAAAFGTLSSWLPYLLCIAVFVFAYSTMISWGYYGERAVEYLVGKGGIWPYRIVFLACVVIGPMVSLLNMKNFTDLLILSMAYPNIIGVVILSPKLAALAKDYVRRLRAGEMDPDRQPDTNGTDI